MKDTQHQILEKYGFWQTISITSWEARFIHNCRKEVQVVWPLTTCETDKQVEFWLGRSQNSRLNTDTFHENQVKLNLQKKEEGQHECRGRIQGRSKTYDEFCSSVILGPSAKTAHKESYQRMLCIYFVICLQLYQSCPL